MTPTKPRSLKVTFNGTDAHETRKARAAQHAVTITVKADSIDAALRVCTSVLDEAALFLAARPDQAHVLNGFGPDGKYTATVRPTKRKKAPR